MSLGLTEDKLLNEIEQLKLKLDSMIIVNGQALACSSYVKDAFEQLKSNEQQLLENGRGYEERIRELQLEDYDKALMINVLKANEQRYIEALKTYAELEILENDGANCAQNALAQSPQQVEVYRAERAVLAGAYTHWRNQTPESSNKLMDSVYELYAIYKEDKGE
jgi:cell division GTPase FtsZ